MLLLNMKAINLGVKRYIAERFL